MNVFDLDRVLVSDYERFARSFTQIRAPDIREQVEAIYASGQFWPEPLISINSHFERAESVQDLVDGGSLHPASAQVFCVRGEPITLHRHQAQAVAKATAGQSFVVTTGTGSGKSLCFFVPIIDAAIRARAAGKAPRTRAIVIYPMNALANSQVGELEKFMEQSSLTDALRPTFARYTGQESHEERERIRHAKPDILLTNFMMLELLMTRQNELDKAVIGNAQGVDFIVLDELHTYRGRQGADVAMLMRRVHDRLCHENPPVCIGTSATMANEGKDDERASAVASVATRMFGTEVPPSAVIDESLERATEPSLKPAAILDAIGKAVDTELPAAIDDEALRRHPLAVWIELEIGLADGQRLTRRRPTTIVEAAQRLAEDTGRDVERCRAQLETMLTLMSQPAIQRGGVGDRAFLAFKLHRFVSGAGHVFATLRAPPNRRVTLDAQRFDPADESRLYPTFFCRHCGQEHHPATIVEEAGHLAGTTLYGPLVGQAQDLAGVARAFHWPLEFPDVMASGGFDAVLGNPPWDRIKLSEQEFFATRDPEIAQAPNAAARGRLIASIKAASQTPASGRSTMSSNSPSVPPRPRRSSPAKATVSRSPAAATSIPMLSSPSCSRGLPAPEAGPASWCRRA